MKKIKSNNKGFSLIELIIVIAIMAVLVAIIAPNLTKYLGSSKTQTDKKNLDEVESQIKNCISDASTNDIAITTGNLVFTGTGAATVTCSPADAFTSLCCTALGTTSTKSKVTPANTKITVTVSGTDAAGYTVKASFTK